VSEGKLFPAIETDRECALEILRQQVGLCARESVARDLLAGATLSQALMHTFEVKDEDGATVLKIPFAEAVEAGEY
jgi:hypothetical protein